MQLTAAELNELKTLVYARKSIVLLGDFPEKTNLDSRLKAAKKEWWRKVRSRYNLPRDQKFAIELDGDRAGEIRYKRSGGRVYSPSNSYSAPHTADRNSSCNPDELVNILNRVFFEAGVNLSVHRN